VTRIATDDHQEGIPEIKMILPDLTEAAEPKRGTKYET
jgi:hypothetical protein